MATIHCKANEQDLADKMMKVFNGEWVGQKQSEKVKIII